MLRTRTTLIAGTACLAMVGLTSAVALRMAETDYSKLPVDAKQTEEKLDALDTSLANAVRKAEEELSGKAMSATVDPDASPPSVTVVVFAEEAEHHVTLNAQDMSILSKETLPPYELPGWEVEGEWTETSSGLKYWDLEEGDGAPADSEKRVTVHYTGYLVDGTKFDSSRDRGPPSTFPLNRVIPGWTEGVGSMRQGGRRKLVVPFELAYGASGRPPVIPPRAMLIFDVELITVHE